ncbi:MAG TPA: DNA-binding protein [Clostridiales bacterium]|nr:DNA-binding protein [Clostridiales bacterium]
MTVRIKEWPGTALSSKDFETGRVLTVHHKPKAEYRWDAGVAIGRYLRELKEGRLIARRCNACGRILLPPRMFCEECFVPTSEWVFVKDTGTVNTFSICHVRWDMVRLKDPQLPAVINVDGASPGMGILHLLGEVRPEDVRVGMRVQAVWKSPEEREGAITDIKYWKPI